MLFVQINLYTKNGKDWSDAIPGQGGSTLVAKEARGMHNNDEALKMATTDALGTAMKQLGVAADIYAGLWDGSKYRDEVKAPASPPVLEGGMVEKGEELAEGYTAQEFRKDIKLIDQIKAASKKEAPAVMKVINAIPDGEKRTIGQIIKELKG
jgi:hypothetical protein